MKAEEAPGYFLVDGYNVIHQDPELERLVEERGLAAARDALRAWAERHAQRAGCRIRLVLDGRADPMSHIDASANQWVEVTFTSSGEEADDRLVAAALEMRRGGLAPIIVSDDREGVCTPLRGRGFRTMSTRDFVGLLRQWPSVGRSKESALSRKDRAEIEAALQARGAGQETAGGVMSARADLPQPGAPHMVTRHKAAEFEPSRHAPRRTPGRRGKPKKTVPDDAKESAFSSDERSALDKELLARAEDVAREDDGESRRTRERRPSRRT